MSSKSMVKAALLAILLTGLIVMPSIAQKIPAVSTGEVSAVSVKGPGIPISPTEFTYTNGGADMPTGTINQQYFQGCFQDVYGILGISNNTGQPVGATATAKATALINSSTLSLMKSPRLELTHTFQGRGGLVSVYLMAGADEDGPSRLLGTITSKKGNCAVASFNLAQAISQMPSAPVYQLILVRERGLFGFGDVVIKPF